MVGVAKRTCDVLSTSVICLGAVALLPLLGLLFFALRPLLLLAAVVAVIACIVTCLFGGPGTSIATDPPMNGDAAENEHK
ncbi:MAG: hypothetical protein GY715_16665 [Planctomycetes bacterium]|nr:hypothetical protein [Planctomycetota bacterium]